MNKADIKKIDCLKPDSDIISLAIEKLIIGEIVIAPTETRYGMLTRADSEESVKKLFALKQRSKIMPTAVFVGNLEMMMHYGEMTPAIQRLAKLFLPGPVTLIIKALGGTRLPVIIDGKIGMRISSSLVIEKIMENTPFPVTATSANISGAEDNTTIDEIYNIFGDEISLYLDGGRLDNITSTVIDCTANEPVILREGAVSKETIMDALKGVTK